MNHLRLLAEKRVQRYYESCRFTHVSGRKYKRFVRKICGNEEKAVILCGEWVIF